MSSGGQTGPSGAGSERDALIDKKGIKRVAYLEAFPKVIDYEGYELPGDLINAKVLDNLQDMDVRETDILIVSYPQSGSAVVEELVVKLVDKHFDNTPSRRTRRAQVAKLEASHPIGHLRWLNGLKAPRILSTNLPLNLLPYYIKTPICKIIYLLRNPKDQSVSYYYQHRVKGILSSFDDFIALYMNGHLLYGDYFSHVLDFWQLSRLCPQNVLVVTFEEMKLESHSMAKLIANFLNLSHVTGEDVDQLCAITTTTSNGGPNKAIADLYQTVHTNDDQSSQQPKDSRTVYTGVLGDWLNYYSPDQSRQMDDLIRQRLDRLGLSLCCDSTEAAKRLAKYGRILLDTKAPAVPIDTVHNNDTTSMAGVGDGRRRPPKLAKEEYVLLRNKSLLPIPDYISLESDSQDNEQCCCTRTFGQWWQWFWCCPCFGNTTKHGLY